MAVPSVMEHLYRCRQGKPFPSMRGNNAGAERSAVYDAVVLPYMAYVRFPCLAGHGARFRPVGSGGVAVLSDCRIPDIEAGRLPFIFESGA